MAISRCSEIVISRKKFSDFDLIDPVTKEDTENLFIAGYTEDATGHKENVKIKASTFINARPGAVITSIDTNTPNDLISFVYERVDGDLITISNINYSNTNFIQINKLDNSLFSRYNGKDYFCIRLSPNTSLGSVVRMYLPNFPQDKGILLFPTSSLNAASDKPKEILFNDGVISQKDSDYYFTLIQLADPQNVDGTGIQNKTKVIEVINITTDI